MKRNIEFFTPSFTINLHNFTFSLAPGVSEERKATALVSVFDLQNRDSGEFPYKIISLLLSLYSAYLEWSEY